MAAFYNEVQVNGSAKQQDSLNCKEICVSGTTPALACPEMEKQLPKTQDMMKVDGITGATCSIFHFRYA